MKKLFALALFLVASPLFGQVTISNDYSALQATRMTRAMNRTNRETCALFAFPADCTQPQVRKEFCRRAGVGGVTTCVQPPDPTLPPVCTTTPLDATCPGALAWVIFPDLKTFHKRESVRLITEEYAKKDSVEDVAAFLASPSTATLDQKNAWCESIGKAAGCL